MGVGDSRVSNLSVTMTRRAPISFRIGPLPILAIAIATLYFAHEILIPLAFALTLTLIFWGSGGNGITFSEVAARILTDLFLDRKNEDQEVFRFNR